MNVPSGIIDQAITWPIVITRPSMWLGAMVWRRLSVLILKNIVSPAIIAQITRPAQYQGVSPRSAVNAPFRTAAPRIAVLKLVNLRSVAAISETTRKPTPPAVKNSATWASLPLKCSFTKRTICASIVLPMKMMNSNISEMLRSTGWPNT